MTTKQINEVFDQHGCCVSMGFMTGTSMDGIDAAVLLTDGEQQVTPLGHLHQAFSRPFKIALKAVELAVQATRGAVQSAQVPTALVEYCREALSLSEDEIAQVQAEVLLELGVQTLSELSLQRVEAVLTQHHATLFFKLKAAVHRAQPALKALRFVLGFHGQTIYHDPKRCSIQLGDGAQLASATGAVVVNHFRADDVAQGGQGAPLAPLYHQALLTSNLLSLPRDMPVAFVNCGGIANVSFVSQSVLAFDTGPGNVLIDRYIQRVTQGREAMDRDGARAAEGQVDDALFQALYAQALPLGYLQRRGNKALDIHDLSLSSAVIQAAMARLSEADVCRTLAAFTAQTIAESVRLVDWAQLPPAIWVLAGGGWKNPIILSELRARLAHVLSAFGVCEPALMVVPIETLGLQGDAIEAQTFAYLAVRRLANKPTAYPETTGARVATSGGDVHVAGSAPLCRS